MSSRNDKWKIKKVGTSRFDGQNVWERPSYSNRETSVKNKFIK